MSVLRCVLLAHSDLTYNEKWDMVITKKWQVEVSSYDDLEMTVWWGSMSVGPDMVPEQWAPYDLDTHYSGSATPSLYLLKKRVYRQLQEGEDKIFWIIEGEYGPPPDGFSYQFPATSNPLVEPVRFLIEPAHYTKPVNLDVNGNPVVNPAGDPYDQQPESTFIPPTMVAVRNMWPYGEILRLARNYEDAVNSDYFYDHPPGTAKVESISVGPLSERSQVQYYPVTFRIQFIGTGTAGAGTGTGGEIYSWYPQAIERGPQIVGNALTGTFEVSEKYFARVNTGTYRGEYLHQVNLNADGSQRDPSLPPLTRQVEAYNAKPFADLGI